MTVGKAAKKLGKSRQTIHNWIAAGKLKATKIKTADGQWMWDVHGVNHAKR